MHDDFFLRPSPPPRPTSHLWLGVLLSGCVLGLGAFYMRELQSAPSAQIVLDIGARASGAAASDAQVAALLGDVKTLMAELRQTQHALAEAQTRIAALEQENKILRDTAPVVTSAADPAVSPVPVVAEPPAPVPPAAAPAVSPADGIGGPLIRAPDPAPIAARSSAPSSGPRACWMRGGAMVSIYRIAIRDDGFALLPAWPADGTQAWPDEFGSAMTEFSGRPLTDRAVLSRAAFKKMMRPYYNFGVKQEARCRFLVTVSDQTSNRESWQSGLALVERYFFKKIRGGGSDSLAFKSEP